MYAKSIDRHFIHTVLCALLLLCAPTCWSMSEIVFFDFDGAGGFEPGPEFIAPSLSTLGWTPQKGTLSDFSGTPGRALAARQFADSNLLILDVEITDGFTVDLTALSFDHLASSSGPTQWQVSINDVLITFGATALAFETAAAMFEIGGIRDNISIVIRGSGARSNSGTFRMDNFSLGGSVNPVPIVPPIALLSSAVALLPLLRRR